MKIHYRLLIIALFIVNIALSTIGETNAEMFVSGYLGVAYTHDSDVELNRPGWTNLTFGDVSWDDDSFASPIYYGLRAGYWFHNRPNWGLAVDFTHAKMISDLNQTVGVSGTRSGTAISGQERLGQTFADLSFSHGHNLLTFNGMYRWMDLDSTGQGFLNRLQPYVIAGLGIAYPHVEVTVEGDKTYDYQTTGLAAQAGTGLDVDVTRWFSVFAEYRLSYAAIEADLVGGGTLKTEPWTHHFTLGITFSLLN